MPRFENIEVIENFNKFLDKTQLRENVINWYDFKQGSNILEIGADFGQATNFFIGKEFNITSLEVDMNKYNFLKSKYLKFKKCELLNQNLIDFYTNSNKKYDYIIVTTSMLRIDEFVLEKDRNKAFSKLLDISYSLLNDNGIIIMAINNKFSIKSFSGATTSNTSSYDILSGRSKSMDTYSKKEIINFIKDSEFNNYKFYYPFPDYKLPSVIYSDEYLPNNNSSKLKYLIYYNPEDTIVFNEIEVLREVIKDGMLDYFANSYIVEIAKNKYDICNAKFVSFNNFRKEENKMITKIYDEYVEKTNIFNTGKSHIENIKKYIDLLTQCGFDIIDEVKDNKIYSKFQKIENLNDILSDYILNDNKQEALKIIDNWYNYLKDKFERFVIYDSNIISNKTVFEKYGIDIPEDLKKNLIFLKYGFFDIIFENIFIKLDKDDNFDKFLVYDQEWCEENLPIEYILYRALNNLFYYNSKITKYIKIEDLYEMYEITEYIDYFKKLEEKIQHSLLDMGISNIYKSTYVALTTLEAMQETMYYEKKGREEIKDQFDSFIKHVEHTNNEWQIALDAANDKISVLEKKLENKNSVKGNIKNIFKK